METLLFLALIIDSHFEDKNAFVSTKDNIIVIKFPVTGQKRSLSTSFRDVTASTVFVLYIHN